MAQYQLRIELGRMRDRIQADCRIHRRFVWIVDPGKAFDIAVPGLCVHALRVTRFADLQGSIDKDFNKAIGADHRAHVVARGAVRTDGRTDSRSPMAYDLGRDETDAANVQVPIFFVESQALG